MKKGEEDYSRRYIRNIDEFALKVQAMPGNYTQWIGQNTDKL